MFPASSENVPQIAVAKLYFSDDTVVQDVHFFASSSNSNKYYCLTAASHDRAVRLWNPMRVVVEDNDDSLLRANRKARQQTQPTAYSKLPCCLEVQTYRDGYAYDVSSVCVARDVAGNAGDALLAACQKTLVLTDLITAKVTRRLQHHHTGKINKVCSLDQNLFVTASFDTTVALWDGRSRNSHRPIQVLKDATDSVTDLWASHGPRRDTYFPYLYTSSVDGCVRCYDMRRGTLTVDNVGSPITSMAVTKNGENTSTQRELAVTCLDGTIRLLDASVGGAVQTTSDNLLLNTYSNSHAAGNFGIQVDCLADSATIVSGSEDGHVVLYDLVSANCHAKLNANLLHNGKPTCTIAAHPRDASVLITASYDTSTIVWSSPQNYTRWGGGNET
jgi:WD40 repeat protein